MGHRYEKNSYIPKVRTCIYLPLGNQICKRVFCSQGFDHPIYLCHWGMRFGQYQWDYYFQILIDQ